MPDSTTLLASQFATLAELIHAHARERGDRTAIASDAGKISYAELDATMDRVAAALQRDGVATGAAVAIVAAASIDYAAVFLGALRAGCVPAPIAPSALGSQIAAMIADCGAPVLFLDRAAAATLAGEAIAAKPVALDGSDAGAALADWLAPLGSVPEPVGIAPADPFNIIYSSGTTGTPKGIVQPHSMRWSHITRAGPSFAEAVTMIATPLYSNTTLVAFVPTLGWGGTAVLMPKFEGRAYLELAERHRATHTMLVPVQYQRIMALPEFDRFDLSSFRLKTCTSAPFSPALKADVLARWPGLLIEYYGMTEGGGTCILNASARPDKLHTVGQPAPDHDIRLIDEEGHEVARGEMGEVVGRSPQMMTGYHRRDEATDAVIWRDAQGNRFIRHGDVGRFDEEGFLILMDRKKDVIISGGFNIYPTDLEAILAGHPDVADCTVVGVPSEAWGETPIGFYVARGGGVEPAEILAWANARLGKAQRLAALQPLDALPRSAIGKVLKRELRDAWVARQ